MRKLFVSFKFTASLGRESYGTAEVTVDKPVTGCADLDAIAESIRLEAKAKTCTIVYWRRFEEDGGAR